MRRSLNHVLLVVTATAIAPACKQHCEASDDYLAEWDYNHGDRCPLELPKNGWFDFSPSVIHLTPSVDGTASKTTFTLNAFIDEKITVADGYVVNVKAMNNCTGLTLGHASVETPCFIESDSLLRCLLDSTGTTKIEVSSTRSTPTPTPTDCYIEVSSGNNIAKPINVEITHPADSQAIAIHSPLENGTICDSSTPCLLVGKLAAAVCTPAGAPMWRTAEFYVATERNGVLASNPADVRVTAEVIRMGAGRADIYGSGDCQNPDGSDMVITKDKAMSKSRYLCADGGAGVYQLLAVADVTAKNDSLVLSAPTAPYRITATKTAKDAGTASDGTTGEGTTSAGTDESTGDPSPSAEFTYTVNVTDLDSAGIPELAVEIVTDDNAYHKMITDAFGSATHELPTDLSTLRIYLPAWDFVCTIELP